MMIEGRPYKVWRYQEVLKEQMLIGFLSQGAITLTETNDLPVNDRKILLNTLQKIDNEKSKRREEIKNRKANKRGKR